MIHPLSLLCFVGGTLMCYGESGLLVDTNLGKVQGHVNGMGVREWNGIPYSEPPVGNLRFEQSRYPQPWEDIYNATYMVWAPEKPSENPSGYPVYFWIHGGSFEQGEGDCGLYNATYFAELGVVSVVINYRLGALGFMASESMEGNYGLLDQRLALQWTRDNIAGFGGNADHITVGGQSAGGSSVGAHLISKGSAGLFHQGIMESNPLALPFHNRESATDNANAVFEYCGCADDDVVCMRSVSVDDILLAQKEAPTLNLDNLLQNFLTWSPLIEDGGEIEEQPLVAMGEGRMTNMNLLSGTVKDEGQLFVYELFTAPLDEKAYEATLLAVFGKNVYQELSALYPFDLIEGSNDGREVLNVLATDLIFYCPLRNVTRGSQAVNEDAAPPAFVYRFDHVFSFDCWGPDYDFCVGYVCHSSELPFQFNTFTIEEDGVVTVYPTTPDEDQLTEDVSHIWANFISSGNPNDGYSIPKYFPAYQQKADEILVLEEPGTEVKAHQREVYCDFWDKVGYYY